MPRLSLWKNERSNDYRFIDRIVYEQYVVGGLDVHVHKYLGPKPDDPTLDPDLNQIQDVLFGENRNRKYEDNVYSIRAVYNVQDLNFDLSQFGLFVQNDTIFLTVHYNNMIDLIGRKIISGDVIEVPNLRDYHPNDPRAIASIPKYYVVQDAAFAAEGFSQTWRPHLWRLKCEPLTSSQEFDDILNKIIEQDDEYIVYTGDLEDSTLDDLLSTYDRELANNEAILAEANLHVPMSGYDVTKFYIIPPRGRYENFEYNLPDNNYTSVNCDSDNLTCDTDQLFSDRTYLSPETNAWTAGYLTGDGIPPNGLPVTAGVSFPANPIEGDFCLRLDYFPNRLFRFNGKHWCFIEDKVRTKLDNGDPENFTRRNMFINNDKMIETTDRGLIPSRQALNELLEPKEDN